MIRPILLAAVLAFAPILPERADAKGIYADVYSLVDAIGVGATLAAVSFGAYLVGVFSAAGCASLISLWNAITGPPAVSVNVPPSRFVSCFGSCSSLGPWAGRPGVRWPR